MKTLFLAWQDPVERSWYPVGRLDWHDNDYRFVYTKGALKSERFISFGGMQDLKAVYKSKDLFPLFINRLISNKRSEYKDFLHWVNVQEKDAEPLALLARTGGVRETDSLVMFPCPEPDDQGRYVVHFFSHGLRYLGPQVIDRVAGLKAGDPLYLMPDPQNEHDEFAIALRTDDPKTIVGYCPRFMTRDFLNLLDVPGSRPDIRVEVERVNSDAPIQFRLLCYLSAKWQDGFLPCAHALYQPLSQEAAIS